MKHIGTQKIETARLILREFNIDDVTDAYNNFYSNPKIAMYMQFDAHTDIAQTKEYLNNFFAGYKNSDFYRWAISLKSDNKVIGSIGFTIHNERDSVADLSYALSETFWNQGIITEALKVILQYGLLKVGINRIEAFHSIDNPASGKVMQKAGMKYEGHLRQKYKSHKGFEDCDLYAILKEDLFSAI